MHLNPTLRRWFIATTVVFLIPDAALARNACQYDGDCEPDEFCIDGACVCFGASSDPEVCGVGETCCIGVRCADLDTDPLNCGYCRVTCGQGESCNNGRCRCGDTIADAFVAACVGGRVCCGRPGECRIPPDCVCGTVSCADGQTCCAPHGGQSCIDTATDPLNCGSCGLVCPQGQTCNGAGQCELLCQPELTNCGDLCVDTFRDREHCGGCGNVCPPGQVCDGTGQCRIICQTGLVLCGNQCVDLSQNRDHCGTCVRACPSGEICDGFGSCEVSCQSGFVDCGGRCVDLNRDREHCGTCGLVCGPGEICDGSGQCELSCQIGFVDCYGRCVDLNADRDHCGTCGLACGPGEVCDGYGQCDVSCQARLVDCGGQCVNLSRDREHCGTCLNACQPGEICNGSGQCEVTCQKGLADCAGQCTDLLSDERHCGQCGNVCRASWSCQAGVCWTPCSDVDTADCGDLDLDVLVTNLADGRITVLRNDGVGGYGDAAATRSDGAQSAVVADLTGDGRLDVVVAQEGDGHIPSGIRVHYNIGDVVFDTQQTVEWGVSPTAVVIADFTGDGISDVAATDSGGPMLAVFPVDGFGTLGEPIETDIGRAWDLVAADITGDGLLDLVVSLVESAELVTLENIGSGRFQVLQRIPLDDRRAMLAVTRLDRNRGLDILAVLAETDTVSIFRSEESSYFHAFATLATGQIPVAITVGDLNGDLYPDALVANAVEQTVSVFINDGAGNLGAEYALGVGREPRDVALGDFNGDGSLDAVVLRRVGEPAAADVLPLFNDGAGRLSLGVAAPAGGPAFSLSLGDFESGNTCTDLSNNSTHCGLCGAECVFDEFCQDGQCVLKADIDGNNTIDLLDFGYLQSVFGGPN